MNKTQVKNLMSKHGYELDNDGQVVFYSGWYEYDDGSLHTEPEYSDEDEEDDD